MTTGYKIDVSPYKYKFKSEVVKDEKFVIDEVTGEPKIEEKVSEVDVKIHLPLMLCNPNIGGTDGRPDADFDLFEMGVIAKQIEKSDGCVILDEKKYEQLKARMKKIQKHLNYKYFEMVRRIHEAEKVELEEKK